MINLLVSIQTYTLRNPQLQPRELHLNACNIEYCGLSPETGFRSKLPETTGGLSSRDGERVRVQFTVVEERNTAIELKRRCLTSRISKTEAVHQSEWTWNSWPSVYE